MIFGVVHATLADQRRQPLRYFRFRCARQFSTFDLQPGPFHFSTVLALPECRILMKQSDHQEVRVHHPVVLLLGIPEPRAGVVFNQRRFTEPESADGPALELELPRGFVRDGSSEGNAQQMASIAVTISA
jgi:hypothetical protein